MRDNNNLYQVGSGQDGENGAFLMYFEGKDDILMGWTLGIREQEESRKFQDLTSATRKTVLPL